MKVDYAPGKACDQRLKPTGDDRREYHNGPISAVRFCQVLQLPVYVLSAQGVFSDLGETDHDTIQPKGMRIGRRNSISIQSRKENSMPVSERMK
jgi:hypothetical protein